MVVNQVHEITYAFLELGKLLSNSKEKALHTSKVVSTSIVINVASL